MIPVRESNPRRMVALNNMELTQAFRAHEEQLATLQTQVAIVFKLPADAVLAKSLISVVQGWQKSHHPGRAHPQGSCNQAVCAALLHELAKSSLLSGIDASDFKAFVGTAESKVLCFSETIYSIIRSATQANTTCILRA